MTCTRAITRWRRESVRITITEHSVRPAWDVWRETGGPQAAIKPATAEMESNVQVINAGSVVQSWTISRWDYLIVVLMFPDFVFLMVRKFTSPVLVMTCGKLKVSEICERERHHSWSTRQVGRRGERTDGQTDKKWRATSAVVNDVFERPKEVRELAKFRKGIYWNNKGPSLETSVYSSLNPLKVSVL